MRSGGVVKQLTADCWVGGSNPSPPNTAPPLTTSASREPTTYKAAVAVLPLDRSLFRLAGFSPLLEAFPAQTFDPPLQKVISSFRG